MLRCFWTKAETGNGHDHFARRVAAYSTAWSPGFDSCSTNAGRVLAWDGWTPAREWRAGADGAESVLDYYWGTDLSGTVGGAGGVGGLLAVSLDGAWYAPLYDGCGNVVAYVSETGAVVAEYRYDAFGETLSQSGPLAGAFPFRFSTKRLDAETGLYYYGARYYSPALRRWISEDPAGEDGGLNLYAFVGNTPTLYADPFGLDTFQLRWVKDGPVYDGKNLWAAVWLWPLEVADSGYVTSTHTIDDYKFENCDGSPVYVAFHHGIGTYTTYSRSAFLNGNTGTHGNANGGIYIGSRRLGGFRSGLYYSLIDTSMTRTTDKTDNLKCGKGEVKMTFAYTVHRGIVSDKIPQPYTTTSYEHRDDDSNQTGDLFPFCPEAIHKVSYAAIDENIDKKIFHLLSIHWNRCNGKDAKLEFTELPRGPNRNRR